MAQTYDGGLGTTVTVNPVDSTVTVGFDSTLVLLGEAEGDADENELTPLNSQAEADEQFGGDVAAAFNLAKQNGAGDILGVAVDAGDFTTAAEVAIDADPRYIVPVTMQEEDALDVHDVVVEAAEDLTFSRVIAPGKDVDPGDVGSYEPVVEDQRFVEVAPQTATVDGVETVAAAAVAGLAATQPLGSSITYNELNGIEALGVEYGRSTAQSFEQVTAITGDGQVVEGVTTSDESAFSDIFQVEILDTVILGIDEVAQDAAGDKPNTPDDRASLENDVVKFLSPLAAGRPPLLAGTEGGQNSFNVEVDAVDETTVELTAAVSPVDVMKTVDITLNVGSVVALEDVSA